MWPFFNRTTLLESGILNGYTDYHSHVLPGVDDGIPTMEESLEALNRMEEWGVKVLWCTPHIMEDIPNTTEQLRKRFEELKATYTGRIELHLAAEYMMDNLFEERLQQKDLLPLGEGRNHLLVETSYFNPPMDLLSTLAQVKQQGFHPVLAHPERYVYMDKKDYLKLKEQHIKFQLNLSSLAGIYGKTVQKKATYLLKKRMYDVTGTDIHALHSFTKVASLRSYSSQYSRLASKQGQAFRIDNIP